jgi:hypothetical protein
MLLMLIRAGLVRRNTIPNYLHIRRLFGIRGKSIIIRNAVLFVFLLAALSFCAVSPCVVSLSLFPHRFDVARSVPSSLPSTLKSKGTMLENDVNVSFLFVLN